MVETAEMTTEAVETTAESTSDNSGITETQEPTETREVLGENSDEDEATTEPEKEADAVQQEQQVQESKFKTLDDALKGYSELEKKLGQQSNELGELRKQAAAAQQLQQRIAQIQLQEAQQKGFESVKALEDHKEVARFTADEFAKHLNECEFPDEMAKLLSEYRNNPTQQTLDTIKADFSVETLEEIAGKKALYMGQLQARDNLMRENEIKQSAQTYLDTNVNKFADKFKNPAFTALYGEAFRAYGCDLNTEKFVELMDNYAASVAKANGIQNGIHKENKDATNEIAGLTSGNTGNTGKAGSGKSLLNMSEKELDKRLSELI